jgi:hypothetical protein
MAKYVAIDLGTKTGTTTGLGTAVNVSELENVTVGVAGTFTRTLQLMISFDGTVFQQFGANITSAAVITNLPPKMHSLRVDVSAATSGTSSCRGGGSDPNRIP